MGLHAVVVVVVVMAVMSSVGSASARELVKDDSGCEAAPALFIFGASYMDVGENRAAMPFRSLSEFPPYGIDFPGGIATGRISNGRLIVDHLSEAMGHGYIDPYLKTVGADFHHGVNFASSGSKACNSSIVGDGSDNSGLFSLSVQVDQFRDFKHQTLSMYQKYKRNEHGILPSAQAFSNGVYIIEAGNNDLNSMPISTTHDEFAAMSFLVIKNIEIAIRRLYNEGARIFLVIDAFPAHCYPCALWKVPKEKQNEDGCIADKAIDNNYHNFQIGKLVAALDVELVEANIVLFHLKDIIMDGIRNPSKYGLKNVRRACCGGGGGEFNVDGIISCGQQQWVDGKWRKYTVCENRSEYMMWDGLHLTDAFNYHIAQALVRGDFTTPSFSIKEMCLRQKQ